MTSNERLESIIQRLVNSTDPDEVKSLYRDWSDTYDTDLKDYGYVAPEICCAIFSDFTDDKNTPVLDAGCGTGLVGLLLRKSGFTSIDGSDFSLDMLNKAALTGVYSALEQADFSGPLDVEDSRYAGIISVGVYTKRFKENFLTEMIRILKPGGKMTFTCREQYFPEVSLILNELHQSKTITRSEIRLDSYMTRQQALAYYISLQKCTDQLMVT